MQKRRDYALSNPDLPILTNGSIGVLGGSRPAAAPKHVYPGSCVKCGFGRNQHTETGDAGFCGEFAPDPTTA